MSEIFGGIDAMTRALGFHLERHNVISSNIANVDTPEFRPLELVREDAGGTGAALALDATRDGHIGVSRTTGEASHRTVEDTTAEVGSDGNAVSVEREMSKLAANQLKYDGIARIVARRLGALRYAANDGQGG